MLVEELENLGDVRRRVSLRIRELEAEEKEPFSPIGSCLGGWGRTRKQENKSTVEAACMKKERRQKEKAALKKQLRSVEKRLEEIRKQLNGICCSRFYGFTVGVAVVFLRHVDRMAWDKVAARVRYSKHSCRKFYNELLAELERAEPGERSKG